MILRMSEQLQEFPLTEIVVCESLDSGVLTAIEAALDAHRDAEGHANALVQFDAKHELLSATTHAPTDALREVAEGIWRFQAARGGLRGLTVLHTAFIPYHLYDWHSELINDAFVASTRASTQGLKGTIEAQSRTDIEASVRREAAVNSSLSHVATLQVVSPPKHALLHLPYGAMHRSPEQTDPDVTERLIVNGVVQPSFLMPLNFSKA